MEDGGRSCAANVARDPDAHLLECLWRRRHGHVAEAAGRAGLLREAVKAGRASNKRAGKLLRLLRLLCLLLRLLLRVLRLQWRKKRGRYWVVN